MAYVAALLKGDYERAVGLIDCALLTCSAEEVASELLGATSQMNAVALALGSTHSLFRALNFTDVDSQEHRLYVGFC